MSIAAKICVESCIRYLTILFCEFRDGIYLDSYSHPCGNRTSDGLITSLQVAFSVAAKNDPHCLLLSFSLAVSQRIGSRDRRRSSADQSHHHRDHEQDNRDVKNELRDLNRESSDPAEAKDGGYQRDDQEG